MSYRKHVFNRFHVFLAKKAVFKADVQDVSSISLILYGVPYEGSVGVVPGLVHRVVNGPGASSVDQRSVVLVTYFHVVLSNMSCKTQVCHHSNP